MKKVLIAEDSSVIQNLTKKILQFQNFEIIAAKNGQKVMETIAKGPVDVILMDINMPILDGIECAKQIRANSDAAISSIPIIAITGNAHNHTEEFYKSVGFTEYLQKPLDFDRLVEVVKKHTGSN